MEAIDSKVIKQMLRQAKAKDDEFYVFEDIITFIDDRWYWIANKHNILLTDIIPEHQRELLNNKVLHIREGIEKYLQGFTFDEEAVNKYKVDDEVAACRIKAIKSVFTDRILTPEEKDVVILSTEAIRNINNLSSFFCSDNVRVYFSSHYMIFNEENKYLIVATNTKK